MTNLTYRFITLQPFNRSSLSSTMTHLDCSQCGSEVDVTELCLKDYPSLESIHIGSYSFPHILIVEVRHLPKLKQFVVKDHCFMHPETIVPENACCGNYSNSGFDRSSFLKTDNSNEFSSSCTTRIVPILTTGVSFLRSYKVSNKRPIMGHPRSDLGCPRSGLVGPGQSQGGLV